jgi:predicted metal-binding protein
VALLICRTCPRYDHRATGEFGRAMVAAIRDRSAGDAVAVRNVQCLGGCPDDGVVAVDGPGQARVRFTGLDVSHAEAVLEAAAAHAQCPSGVPEDWAVPAALADRISAVTRKRPPSG